MARGTSVFYCSMCDDNFNTKSALQRHQLNHEEAKKVWKCNVCKWDFPDELALENHQIQSGHARKAEFLCDNLACQSPGPYLTIAAFNEHQKFPSPCSDAFRPRKTRHAEDDSSPIEPVFELRLPKYIPPASTTIDEDLVTVYSVRVSHVPRTSASNEDIYCDICQKSFPSMSRYNNHWLACGPPRISEVQPETNVPPPPPQPVPPRAVTTGINEPVTGEFNCAIQGCGRNFKSNAGLKVHQADAHSVGGQGLDLYGRDSWMLTQTVREQLKQQGLLRGSPVPSGKSKARRAQNSQNGQALPPPPPGKSKARRARNSQNGHALPPPPNPPARCLRAARVPTTVGNQPLPCQPIVPAPSAGRIVAVNNVGGPEEMAQANELCGKIMRLNLQSDVLIQHDGKITCGGVGWTRIGVSRQSGLIDDFAPLCHLRPIHQAEEYLPPPNAFKKDYQSQYAVGEFKHSAAPTSKFQALAIVAISCIKILLVDGRQEAVKVAAVDVASGRILINNLVCTNPDVSVQDWRTKTTGMTSFQDMEAARQDGYKIFKGWQAARTALWKFVDRSTILVGHNLRADLDSLRMIHGRAVDVVKLIEKAGNGPLSKSQLELDSLCRDLPQLHLLTDRTFGRDCLQNAFAARELALWHIKNSDQCIRWAKQKSLDFQRLG